MVYLAFDTEIKVSIDAIAYALLLKLTEQGKTPSDTIRTLARNHPKLEFVWVCSCEFMTDNSTAALIHAKKYPRHTLSQCIRL